MTCRALTQCVQKFRVTFTVLLLGPPTFGFASPCPSPTLHPAHAPRGVSPTTRVVVPHVGRHSV